MVVVNDEELKYKLLQTSRKRLKSETNTTGAQYQLLAILEDHCQRQLQVMKSSENRKSRVQSCVGVWRRLHAELELDNRCEMQIGSWQGERMKIQEYWRIKGTWTDTNTIEIVRVRIETQMERELAREEMNKMRKD